ncbi:MAG: peroxiredoxin [Rickettsiales bacterium]|nr:peroxiredoxin [Rickettsiales bacterium]
MAELQIGNLAPDFNTNSTVGLLSLDELNDKIIVLYFYPSDMTPGCTMQAQEFISLYDEFKKLNTIIIGVSKDNLSSHHKFCEKENIPYPLLVDTESEICHLYGVIKEKSMFDKTYLGISRTTFIIDQNKKIFKIWKNVKPQGHANEVLDQVKMINHIKK